MGRPKPKGVNQGGNETRLRDFPQADSEGLMYAVATKMLGSGRLMARCVDGVERLAKIRGSMRKSEYIRVADLLLVSTREFQESKVDVLFRYNAAEARILKRWGEVPAMLMKEDREGEGSGEEDCVHFENEEFIDDV